MRVLLTIAAVCAVAAGTLEAQQDPFTCTVNAGVPPLVRAEGITEAVGDLVFTCTGGVTASPLTASLTIYLNANVTSASFAGKPEPLLLIDEPATGAQVLGENVYQATGVGGPGSPNTVVFSNVRLTPPGNTGSLVIRVTNIRANASQLGVSSTLVPSQIVAFISVTPTGIMALSNPQQIVGFVTTGLKSEVRKADNTTVAATTLQQCEGSNATLAVSSSATNAVPTLHLAFVEGFASSFKPRSTEKASNPPPAQAVPGQNLFNESMFYNPSLLGSAGLAQHGTRLMARFTTIPTGVKLYVPTEPSIPRSNAGESGKARLTATDAAGAGVFTPVPATTTATINGATAGIAPLTITEGSATAVWEIDANVPYDVETVSIPVFVAYAANTPGLGTVTVDMWLAPVSTDVLAGSQAVPRFAGTLSSKRAFSISACGVPLPDLEISSVTAPWTMEQGTNFNVSVTVRNIGAGAAEASQLTVGTYSDAAATSLVGTIAICAIPTLAPGASVTCITARPVPGSGWLTTYLGLRADSGGVLVESNVTNNLWIQPMVLSPCVWTITPGTQDVPATGGTRTAVATGGETCSSSVSKFVDWVTLSTPSVRGPGTVIYTLSPNTGAARKTSIRLDDRASDPRVMITQAAASGCAVSIGASQRSYTPATHVAESISVTTTAGCGWSASTDSNWLAVATSSGNGSSNLGYGIAQNFGPARTGRIYIADQELLITQASGNAAPSVAITSPTAAGSYTSAAPAITLAGTASDTDHVVSVFWNTDRGAAGGAFGTTSWNAPNVPLAAGRNRISVFARDSHGQANSAIIEVTYSPAVVTGEALRFVPVTPCRVADTRNAPGPLGAPHMAAGSTRSFPVPSSNCGIPATARAYALNVTVVPRGMLGYISMWPAGQTQPLVSTLNSLDGRIKANAAIVPAGTGGAVSVYAQHATDVILDINGYFVPATDTAALAFYPLTPCRVADTREAARGLLGTPSMAADQRRTLPVLSSPCNIPASARAYSLNFTVVPRGFFGYLTTWPTGGAQPWVSTLNAVTGTIVANAAIVPAGNGGAIDVFTQHATELIVDINGYFAPAAAGGLSLYNVTPCRVFDTRTASGAPSLNGSRNVNFTASACSLPAAARAYAVNATVVPPAFMGYMSLWPEGAAQPWVSTLNAIDAAITSNMAIVPTNNGSISMYSSHPTEVIVDVSGYFAP